MIRSFRKSLTLILVLTFGAAITTGSAMLTTAITDVYGQAGAGVQNIKANYAIEIVPGASNRSNLLHYYPPSVAIPTGTTVAWFNNDPEQPHTVTSGLPASSDSGAVFNSGVMPAEPISFFQYTFDRAGDFSYHCEIHPWRVGIVSVNAATEKGNNFELGSGVGLTWNLTKDFRTLLEFRPLTVPVTGSPILTYNITSFKSNPASKLFTRTPVPLDGSTPLTYDITIFKNSLSNKVFSKTFVVPGAPLPLELISGGYSNQTRVYGPDFSSSGAYHFEAPFFKGSASYTIKVDIVAINSKQPQNKITDYFTLRTLA